MTASGERILHATGLVAGYGAAEEILKGVEIAVGAGEIVTVIGPNGAGKSTLLKVVAGLVPARKGTITLLGADVTRQGAIQRARSGIAFVPQEKNVFGTMTVAENLQISAFADPSGARQRAEALYERYPVLAARHGALARTLSGGQRQMLAMAMGLMGEPRLILLDEPTAGLSPKAADELFEAVVALNRSGLPVLMVEQHAVEALAVSHRGYVLVAGRNGVEGEGPRLVTGIDGRHLSLAA